MTIKTVIVGAGGRMGHALVKGLIEQRVDGLELAGAVDIEACPDLGKDAGLITGAGETGIILTADLESCAPPADVVIDFSSHEATAHNAPRYAEWNTAMVIGTTGLSPDETNRVENAAGKIPVVWAPNMSLGVNLLFSLVTQAAAALAGKGYDIEIIERHHRRKKDAPSGTALGLGQAAVDGLKWNLDEVSVHGRGGHTGERPAKEIGFHAVRAGDIVGDHTVLFATEGECIELSHRATSRDTFANGALQAAAWVAGRTPGLYSMKDVLGLSAEHE
jgi:4-hydroxy-tetrahydrodipicolinate reductase